MVTIISRIIRYGVKNFWRNGWLSTATVVIMVLALLVSVGLILFGVTTTKAVESINEKVDISVYFETNALEDDILSVKESLEILEEVKSVEYISRDDALERFKIQHSDDTVITQALAELDENPLEASLRISAEHPGQYAAIAKYLDTPSLNRLIGSVSYKDNRVAIDRLTAIINYVNRAGVATIVVMALIAGLVVFNTIRLAIYSNRDEIGIMRVVGASKSLVRGPYVVEGIIAGFIAAIASLIVAIPAVHAVSPGLSRFIPGLDLSGYFYSNILMLAFYQIVFGALIGGVSSFIAVRRYLKK